MFAYILAMLKVCHIISGDLWAGAEVMSYHLLKELAALEEVSLSVLLLNDGRLANELRRAGVAVRVLDESLHPFAKLVRMVREHLKRDPPDLLHSHRYKENLLALLATRGRSRIRLVATQHGLPEALTGRPSTAHSFKSSINFFLLSRFFDKTVAVSRDIADHLLRNYSFGKERIAVIHNGIPIPDENPGRPRSGSRLSIGSSGRLVRVKDYPLMVQVAGAVCGKKDVQFKLAGEGPCRQELESMIERLGLQRCFFLAGHLDDMDSFYRGLDIYINTSQHEGIPMTILEAMARGIPVVAPEVGGIREIVEHGVQGFLVQGRDASDFAGPCLELLDNPELRAAMSRAARERAVEVFSAKRMAEDYYRLYRELLAV